MPELPTERSPRKITSSSSEISESRQRKVNRGIESEEKQMIAKRYWHGTRSRKQYEGIFLFWIIPLYIKEIRR